MKRSKQKRLQALLDLAAEAEKADACKKEERVAQEVKRSLAEQNVRASGEHQWEETQ